MAELKKTMGFWMVTTIAFLNLVNTGIFFGVQIGAKTSGIDSLIAWCILAVMSIYIAMCFSELIGMFPSAGGVYEFAKQAYGRFPSFMVGWVVWVSGNIATALFTVAAIDYILPATAITIAGFSIEAGTAKIVCSLAVILFMNDIAYRGVEASARLMMFLSVFMILVFGTILIPGFGAINTAHLTGFTMQWSIILLAIFFLSETFYGWESVSFMSEETEDATRTIPKALITTTTVVALVTIALTTVTIGVLGLPKLLDPTLTKPIIAMLEQLSFAPQLLLFVNIGVVATLLGNASGNIVSLPRLLLALSRDKLFIEQFSDIHPVRQTPYRAIIFQTIVASLIVFAASGGYQKLLELLVPVSLLMYASIIILVPYFRFRKPEQPRTFKAPLGKTLPWFIAAFFLTLLVLWTINEPNAISQLRLLFSFLFFSVPIYLILTYFYDPDSLIGTLSFFSRINLWFENILMPTHIRMEVIDFFKEAKDKHILEFGSGVGTLTLQLAEHVGKNGKVYAVGLSSADVKILQERLDKLGHAHVEVIHDPHLVNRVHPNVKNVDMIVSIGHLSYIQDVGKVLREMNTLLPQRGHVCFIEYIDLFYFLPNPKWLTDSDGIRKIFSEAGFTVTVRVKRGILWKYLLIYGIKESKNVPYI